MLIMLKLSCLLCFWWCCLSLSQKINSVWNILFIRIILRLADKISYFGENRQHGCTISFFVRSTCAQSINRRCWFQSIFLKKIYVSMCIWNHRILNVWFNLNCHLSLCCWFINIWINFRNNNVFGGHVQGQLFKIFRHILGQLTSIISHSTNVSDGSTSKLLYPEKNLWYHPIASHYNNTSLITAIDHFFTFIQ